MRKNSLKEVKELLKKENVKKKEWLRKIEGKWKVKKIISRKKWRNLDMKLEKKKNKGRKILLSKKKKRIWFTNLENLRKR